MKTITNPQLFLDVVVQCARVDFFEPMGLKLPEALPVRFGEFKDFPDVADMEGGSADAVTVSDRFSGRVDLVLLTPKQLDPTHGVGTDAGPADAEGYYLAATTVHELTHAALARPKLDFDIRELFEDVAHNDPDFIRAVRKAGLAGKPCCTYASPDFKAWVDEKVRPVYEAELQAAQ